MTVWLYQLTADRWPTERFRLDIWEDELWSWEVGNIADPRSEERLPQPGDIVVFFYAQKGLRPPDFYGWGFYGWAVVTKYEPKGPSAETKRIHFRPVAPTNRLKMFPWKGPVARTLADEIRVPVKRGNMWPISAKLGERLYQGITLWTASANDGNTFLGSKKGATGS
jgi:hypothetical protein